MIEKIRNIAIIAHVDHGKTTLVDKLLHQSGTLDSRTEHGERIMDSNELERERGITILSKNTAITWKDHKINIVDTPGHADFGGEVERILSMVDSVLLLVDAVEGPMPQTRFVTQKAFAQGLKPIVVINKIDRPAARIDKVIDEVFELFDNLGANDEQLDFRIIYASALQGTATLDLNSPSDNITPLLDAIIDFVPPPEVMLDAPFQMQISSLDYSSYVGAIGVGRITQGVAKKNMPVTIINTDAETHNGKITTLYGYLGLNRTEITEANAGDIIALSGIEKLSISDTLCHPQHVEALPPLTVDEPTVSMTFQVNDSPLAGIDGKYLTSRQIWDRLQQELIHNIALRVEKTGDANKFQVAGRGELHLGILIETMRREGFELAVSSPEVITKEIDGVLSEPFETLVIDIETDHQGIIMEAVASRKGDLINMQPDGKGRVRLDYDIPSRGLIGFHADALTLTSGTGLLYHSFDRFAPCKKGSVQNRKNGVMISNVAGKINGFALWNLQERGNLLVNPQEKTYEGMIVGVHSRHNDLVVNPTKEKQLTNIRTSSTDENIQLTPPLQLTLEKVLAFINTDELVEFTPKMIRLRKKLCKEHERKRASRSEP